MASTKTSKEHQFPQPQIGPGDVGLLKSTFLPSLGRNTTLSVLSYLISYSADRGEIKDCFWGANQVINAWWTALGRSTRDHLKQRPEGPGLVTSITQSWEELSWSQKLLLFGVSLWGIRLTHRIASRGRRRYRSGKGNDDPRYALAKNDPSFWKYAFWKLYLPEAVFQSVIALPFTVPFRSTTSSSLSPALRNLARTVGVGVFGVGFALETLADGQLVCYKRNKGEGLYRDGVWSIVRHPKYGSLFFPLLWKQFANILTPSVQLSR